MRIVRASLCLRFHPADGWTRESVRELLREDKRLARVIPRYYDERDRVFRSNEVDDDLPYDDCEYFAVYGLTEPFSQEALREHEIV